MSDFSLQEYYKLEESGAYKNEANKERLALMPIELVGWRDHIAELADYRAEIKAGEDKDGNPIIQHIRYDGNVFQEGTPVNAEHLGRMEMNDLINWARTTKLEDAFRSLQVQVATLVGQNSNNMPYNTFVANVFDGDLEVEAGWYDEANGRVVLNG